MALCLILILMVTESHADSNHKLVEPFIAIFEFSWHPDLIDDSKNQVVFSSGFSVEKSIYQISKAQLTTECTSHKPLIPSNETKRDLKHENHSVEVAAMLNQPNSSKLMRLKGKKRLKLLPLTFFSGSAFDPESEMTSLVACIDSLAKKYPNKFKAVSFSAFAYGLRGRTPIWTDKHLESDEELHKNHQSASTHTRKIFTKLANKHKKIIFGFGLDNLNSDISRHYGYPNISICKASLPTDNIFCISTAEKSRAAPSRDWLVTSYTDSKNLVISDGLRQIRPQNSFRTPIITQAIALKVGSFVIKEVNMRHYDDQKEKMISDLVKSVKVYSIED